MQWQIQSCKNNYEHTYSIFRYFQCDSFIWLVGSLDENLFFSSGIDTYTHVTRIGNGDNYYLSRALSLLWQKLQKQYGNDAIGTSMVSPSCTASFLLVAVNATLEDSSFKTRSEVATHAHEAVETLRVACENEMNAVPNTEFSCLVLKD